MSDTPRKNRDTLWYFAQGADVRGPVEYGFLQHLMSVRLLLPNHMVCREGEETWIVASEVPGLFSNLDGSRPISRSKIDRRRRRMYPAYEGDPRAPWTISTEAEGGLPPGDDDDEDVQDDDEAVTESVQDPAALTKKQKSCGGIGCTTILVVLALIGAIVGWYEDYETTGRFKLSHAAAAVEATHLADEPAGYWRIPIDLEDIYLHNYVLYIWPKERGFVPSKVKLLEWHEEKARWIDVELTDLNATSMLDDHVYFEDLEEVRQKKGEPTGDQYAHSFFRFRVRPLKGSHYADLGVWVYHKTTEDGQHYAKAQELLWLEWKKGYECGHEKRVYATWISEK